MQIVHFVLLAALLVFAGLQYNDPDWYYWGPVYLVAGLWSYLAARDPQRFRSWPLARYGAPIAIVGFLLGFWSLSSDIKPGWIHVEEAREAFGYLICAATTSLAIWDSRRRTVV